MKEVLTVTTFLEARNALALLSDARVLIATRDITDRGGRRSREEVRLWCGVVVMYLLFVSASGSTPRTLTMDHITITPLL